MGKIIQTQLRRRAVLAGLLVGNVIVAIGTEALAPHNADSAIVMDASIRLTGAGLAAALWWAHADLWRTQRQLRRVEAALDRRLAEFDVAWTYAVFGRDTARAVWVRAGSQAAPVR